MKDQFDELLEAARKVLQDCPWSSMQSVEDYAGQLDSEAQEVKQAVANKDDENLKEELGDLLWDTIVVALIAEKEGRFDAKDVLTGVVEKIKRRKPYIFEGKKVTLEEAERIWHEVKQEEKRQKQQE